MPRYIDADKIFYRERMTVFYNSKPIREDVAFKQDIEDIQTEDVAPITHAHWIVKKETDCYGDHYRTYIICSKCDHLTFKEWNYCPDCGAKMDEEV